MLCHASLFAFLVQTRTKVPPFCSDDGVLARHARAFGGRSASFSGLRFFHPSALLDALVLHPSEQFFHRLSTRYVLSPSGGVKEVSKRHELAWYVEYVTSEQTDEGTPWFIVKWLPFLDGTHTCSKKEVPSDALGYLALFDGSSGEVEKQDAAAWATVCIQRMPSAFKEAQEHFLAAVLLEMNHNAVPAEGSASVLPEMMEQVLRGLLAEVVPDAAPLMSEAALRAACAAPESRPPTGPSVPSPSSSAATRASSSEADFDSDSEADFASDREAAAVDPDSDASGASKPKPSEVPLINLEGLWEEAPVGASFFGPATPSGPSTPSIPPHPVERLLGFAAQI
jgi:hypothetical protein